MSSNGKHRCTRCSGPDAKVAVGKGVLLCDGCLQAYELDRMAVLPLYFAYLSACEKKLTGLPGYELARVTSLLKHRSVWAGTATNDSGHRWRFMHWPSAGNYVRMYKTSEGT